MSALLGVAVGLLIGRRQQLIHRSWNRNAVSEVARKNLRGRRPVRADRRLRTGEKAARAQSAIFDKTSNWSCFYS
jgi:hypothetical protein